MEPMVGDWEEIRRSNQLGEPLTRPRHRRQTAGRIDLSRRLSLLIKVALDNIEAPKMAPICEPPAVVVTGFGPFGDHKTNDSWTTVCQVTQGERGKLLEQRLGVRFIVKEMPVCYEFADQTVPQLWAEHNPLFVLHVGIHQDDLFRIETKSRRTDYHCKDVEGRTPDNCSCKAGSNDVMETTLDVAKLLTDVRKALSDSKTDVKVALSDDPGNYLCGYTYYTSLCLDAGRTLFLHIPPPSSSVPVSHKANVVEAVVAHSLDQVRQKTCPKTTAV